MMSGWPPVSAAVLMQIALFKRVSIEDRERVASVATLREYERGDHVFHEGDASGLLLRRRSPAA
jgi:CRP-like cAMP-binding protein